MSMMRRNFVFSMAAITAGATTKLACGDDWPCWRGPTRDCLSATKLPSKLADLKTVWSIPLGDSYSGPIVFGQQVFTTETVDKKEETLVAVDRETGKVKWKKQWKGSMSVPFFAKENGDWIRSTPATDGKHVIVGGMCDVVACFDYATGEEKWRIDFPKQHQAALPSFGLVCSPLIDGEHVYIHAGGGIRQLKVATGETGWLAMKEDGGMMGGAFSSPIIANLQGKRQLVAATRSAMVGLDLVDGKTIWQREIQTFRGMNILTPMIWNQSVITSSYGGRSQAIALKPGSTSWSTEVIWEGKSEAYMSSPIVVGNYAYLHLKNQRFCCIDLNNGTEKWRTQPYGKYWSMISDGEKILALDQVGKLYLIALNPEKFELLDQLEAADEPCWAHLAMSDKDIVIRSQHGMKMMRG
jgi:outer membrane protein assembly factor BamB